MQRLAAAVTAAFCLTGGLSAPATAEPLMFTVTADYAASARFYLPADTTLSFEDAKITSPGPPGAQYAGVVLYTDDAREIGGILTAPGMSAAGHELDPVHFGRRGRIVLRPGPYRVVVLTDAPVVIRIPTMGTEVSVNATLPDAQTHKTVTTTLPAGGPVTAELRAPMPRSTARTKVAMFARLTPVVANGGIKMLVCTSQRNKPCGKGDTSVGVNINASGPNAWRMVHAGLATDGRPIAGTRDAVARIALTPAAPAPFRMLFVQWNQPKPARFA